MSINTTNRKSNCKKCGNTLGSEKGLCDRCGTWNRNSLVGKIAFIFCWIAPPLWVPIFIIENAPTDAEILKIILIVIALLVRISSFIMGIIGWKKKNHFKTLAIWATILSIVLGLVEFFLFAFAMY